MVPMMAEMMADTSTAPAVRSLAAFILGELCVETLLASCSRAELTISSATTSAIHRRIATHSVGVIWKHAPSIITKRAKRR